MWNAGDRVYSLSHPEMTGTVEPWMENRHIRVLVLWDSGLAFFWPSEDLDWYTRPKEFSSDQAGQISGEVVPKV